MKISDLDHDINCNQLQSELKMYSKDIFVFDVNPSKRNFEVRWRYNGLREDKKLTELVDVLKKHT